MMNCESEGDEFRDHQSETSTNRITTSRPSATDVTTTGASTNSQETQQTLQSGDRASLLPRELDIEEEDECIDGLPESEIQAMAMCQWHMQHAGCNGADDLQHIQHPAPAAEEPEGVLDSNPDQPNLSTDQNAWQRLFSGQSSTSTTPLSYATIMENECWGDETKRATIYVCISKM